MCPLTTQHSIGGLYQAASCYCLGGIDDSGKLMGLAPYGRPGVFSEKILDVHDGRVFVNYGAMARLVRPRRRAEDFQNHFQYYADIARWVQEELERAILSIVDHRHGLCPSRNLAYAGGVALNAVANARILRESKFENLYVQPAAGDNGIAIGCAYYGWLSVLEGERRRHDGSAAFGRRYPLSDVTQALAQRAERLEFVEAPDVIETTASMLASGAIVGWFQGRSEFGPRALGRRSILADPRRRGQKDRINSQIKLREDFRPFAPAVAAEYASTYFDGVSESPYMLLVAPVRPEHADSLAEVTHVDGSCRLQTVSRAQEPTFHSLLTAFARRTGLPVLLNTSLNRRGMPIVETPAEALDFFLECALDTLVIENYVVHKKIRPGDDMSDLGMVVPLTSHL